MNDSVLQHLYDVPDENRVIFDCGLSNQDANLLMDATRSVFSEVFPSRKGAMLSMIAERVVCALPDELVSDQVSIKKVGLETQHLIMSALVWAMTHQNNLGYHLGQHLRFRTRFLFCLFLDLFFGRAATLLASGHLSQLPIHVDEITIEFPSVPKGFKAPIEVPENPQSSEAVNAFFNDLFELDPGFRAFVKETHLKDIEEDIEEATVEFSPQRPPDS